MSSALEIGEGESLVEDDELLWFRQVHPNFFGKESGLVLPAAFRLTDADKIDGGTRISGSLQSMCSAKEAFQERERLKSGSTCGTWGVTVAEAREYGFWVIDDHVHFPLVKGHASLDHCDVYNPTAPKDHEDAKNYKDAKDQLAAAANRRGCLYS